MTEVDFQTYAASDTGRLLKLAYLLTGNAHTAEDLVQETLLRSHRHWRPDGIEGQQLYGQW